MERIDYAQAKTLLKVVVDLMRDDTQKPGVGLELRSTFEKDPEAFFSDHGLFEGDLANVLMRCVMVTPPGKESKARRTISQEVPAIAVKPSGTFK